MGEKLHIQDGGKVNKPAWSLCCNLNVLKKKLKKPQENEISVNSKWFRDGRKLRGKVGSEQKSWRRNYLLCTSLYKQYKTRPRIIVPQIFEKQKIANNMDTLDWEERLCTEWIPQSVLWTFSRRKKDFHLHDPYPDRHTENSETNTKPTKNNIQVPRKDPVSRCEQRTSWQPGKQSNKAVDLDVLKQKVLDLQSELERLTQRHQLQSEINDLNQHLLRSWFLYKDLKTRTATLNFTRAFLRTLNLKNFSTFLSPACQKVRYVGANNGNVQLGQQQRLGRKDHSFLKKNYSWYFKDSAVDF